MLSRVFFLAAALQAALVSATSGPNIYEQNSRSPVQSLSSFDRRRVHKIDSETPEETNPNLGNNIQTRAMGNAILSNRCDYDIWIWSVDQSFSSQAIKVPARSKHTEPFRSPCNGCGVSFKVSKTSQVLPGKHTQFEYSIADGQIYYDISYVDCAQGNSAANCPGHEKGHAIDSPEKTCGRFDCKGGSYCPTQAYYVDFPKPKLGLEDPVKGCGNQGTDMNIYFKMCSDEPNLKKRIAGRIEIDDVA